MYSDKKGLRKREIFKDNVKQKGKQFLDIYYVLTNL